MKIQKIIVFSSALFISTSILISCDHQKENKKGSVENSSPEISSKQETPAPPSFNSQNMEVKTFELKDSASGKSKGWGYDLYMDGHKTIHQPIIPGVAGNNSFKTEEQAKRTGNFAINKMKQTGNLPTIAIKELDSLGITR
ncbi:MAG: hypothetical protein A3F72_08000 [Bacteroidetes bacterium RIFCSPLOWO2_12_FULL_35_15]|nr:MAG: hypothetical protein A3F72_08000 [Bacteroidetes bacterium RIFCSPLOWO2_12_FULL_35_15]